MAIGSGVWWTGYYSAMKTIPPDVWRCIRDWASRECDPTLCRVLPNGGDGCPVGQEIDDRAIRWDIVESVLARIHDVCPTEIARDMLLHIGFHGHTLESYMIYRLPEDTLTRAHQALLRWAMKNRTTWMGEICRRIATGLGDARDRLKLPNVDVLR